MTMIDALEASGWPVLPMTLELWDSLPENQDIRIECSEGNVIMAPFASVHHQLASWALTTALRESLGEGYQVVQDIEVVLSEALLTVRRPDVLVRERDARDATRLVAEEVRLAVEVISPTSRRTDRVTKLSEYAEAGIPEYWIVDLGEDDRPAALTALRLVGDSYEVVGEFRHECAVPACGTEVRIDLDALVD